MVSMVWVSLAARRGTGRRVRQPTLAAPGGVDRRSAAGAAAPAGRRRRLRHQRARPRLWRDARPQAVVLALATDAPSLTGAG